MSTSNIGSLKGKGRGAKTSTVTGRKKTIVETVVEKDIDGDGSVDEIYVSKKVTLSPKKSTKMTTGLDKISVVENTGKVALSPRKSMSVLKTNLKEIETRKINTDPEIIATIPMLSNFEKENPFRKSQSFNPDTAGSIKSAINVEAKSEAEKELLGLGYTPTSVQLHGSTSNMVKTINTNGQKVYVEIEKEKELLPNGDVLVPVTKPSTIPYSLKLGTLEMVGNRVASVAIETENGDVSILKRNENMEPIESNFVHSIKVTKDGELMYQDENKSSKDNTFIPVVHIEEIKENPEAVLNVTDDITRKLRNGIFEKHMKDFEELKSSVEELKVALDKFDVMREDVQNRLTGSLTLLEQWNEIYKQNPPEDEDGIAKYKQLLYNLSYRNDAIDVFLSMFAQVNTIIDSFNIAKRIINESTMHGQKEFENIEKALCE
jgi:hypothetical protein